MITIGHIDADWGAKGLAFEDAGYDGRSVALFAWRSDVALAWAATVEFELNLFDCNR